jgi:hypothetical protein
MWSTELSEGEEGLQVAASIYCTDSPDLGTGPAKFGDIKTLLLLHDHTLSWVLGREVGQDDSMQGP